MGRPKEVSDEAILEAARRCFLEQGTNISAAEIGKKLGVSHTTLFNRFGSKQELLIAALGPPKAVGWLGEFDRGPDERPIAEQLVQLSLMMAAYFEDLHAGLTLLQASGIRPEDIFRTYPIQESVPLRAFGALTQWLKAAQAQQRIGRCDVEMLAATILGSLHNRAFAIKVMGEARPNYEDRKYVETFIALLWQGIGHA